MSPPRRYRYNIISLIFLNIHFIMFSFEFISRPSQFKPYHRTTDPILMNFSPHFILCATFNFRLHEIQKKTQTQTFIDTLYQSFSIHAILILNFDSKEPTTRNVVKCDMWTLKINLDVKKHKIVKWIQPSAGVIIVYDPFDSSVHWSE